MYARISLILLVTGLTGVNVSAQDTARLENMKGTYDITGHLYLPDGNEARTFTGSATWTSAYDGRYVREQFSMQAMGRVLKGEAFLGYSAQRNSYEFVQVDAFNPGMIVLSGAWNEDDESITLQTVSDSRMPMMWKYRFPDDDSFIKEMYRRSGSEWRLMSDYTYRRNESGAHGN